MYVLDLFSGIGGFTVGLERAGMRTIGFCEIDPYCRAVIKKHWPGIPIFEDIRGIDAAGLARLGPCIDLICGGFPCQPFSVAGGRKGKQDDRNLWPEMFRVVSLARPAWIIAENVTGLITMALDAVLTDLESIGYATRTLIIPAAAVGAPHRRDRLWIIATDANRQRLRDDEQRPARRWDDVQDIRHAEFADNGTSRNAVADANSRGREVERQPEPSGLESTRRSLADGLCEIRELQHTASSADVSDAGSTRPSIPESAELRGARRRKERGTVAECDWWTLEPGIRGMAHGVRNRVHRLRCLGNSVVPQIPQIIGEAIMKEHHART
jgi:DNA (cytosine-5)-methyltransferase 1